MQTATEITEAHPTLHGDGNKLASPTDQETSHPPVSQASPGSRGSPSTPKAGGRCPSGRGFLKRKFPLWLNRKGPPNSPQGLAVSKSRLCVEATHESPIQAVRKAPPSREALGWDAAPGKTGTSLLRKLLCLKASKSRLKKPPLGLEASPLQKERCGPVAALSRTADPHGESPLRWKPRAETQEPEGAGSPAKPAETVDHLGASWLAKPWRTFKNIVTTRVRKAPVLSGNELNQGAIGERDLCLPAELETSPVNNAKKPVGEEQSHVIAVEDKIPSAPPPAEADELYGSQEDEDGHGAPHHQMENHRRVEGLPTPLPKLPVHEENACCKENPIPEVVSEVCNVPGGNRPKAGGTSTENKGPKWGDGGHWLEMFAGEDLAELAENPGGQGMVMATGDLRWLNSEDLGGPVNGQKVEGKTAISTRSKPNTEGTEEESVALADSPRQSKCSEEQAWAVSPAKASGGGCSVPPALSENGQSSTVISPPSDTSTAEEVGAPHPAFSQGRSPPTLLQPRPSFSARAPERVAEGRPIQRVALDPPGANSPPPQGSPAGQPAPSTKKPHRATPWLATAGPEEDPKHSIYMVAVEIVESAMDAAAEQVARKREEEGGRWGQAEATAESSAGTAKRQGVGDVDG